MPTDFIQLTSCGNATEADHLVWLLGENDVPAFVDGANANTMLNYVGSALGGVRVFVRADDAERALEILNSAPDETVDQTDWFCGRCHEAIEGDFALCWSCGKPREEVEQKVPMAETAQRDDLPRGALSSPATKSDTQRVEANPYVSPETPGERANSAPLDLDPQTEAEAILERAWKASIYGIAFFPILIHFFSMCLLMRASWLSSEFSPRGQRLFYGAFLVNLAAPASWMLLIYVTLL